MGGCCPKISVVEVSTGAPIAVADSDCIVIGSSDHGRTRPWYKKIAD